MPTLARTPVITIRHEVHIHAPAERCFDLARSVDLHVDSAAEIAARAVGGRMHGLSGAGDATIWSARFCGVRFEMTTRLEDFSRPTRFGDRLTRGLPRRFEHVYRFEPTPEGGCAVSDELTFEAPFPLLGRWLERLYFARRMRQLVRQRLEHIKGIAENGDWRRYLDQPP